MTRLVEHADIERYRKIFKQSAADLEHVDQQQLVDLANWFAEGAITRLGNSIYDELSAGGRLEHGVAQGCRCGSCYEWQLCDDEGKVLRSAETLNGLINELQDPL